MQAESPPILDFSVFRGADIEARTALVQKIAEACRDKGFFQVTGTDVSLKLQERIIEASKDFFNLPMDENMKCDLRSNRYHRGYEKLRDQRLEPGAAPDHKEAIYFAEHLPLDHPRVKAGEYNCGPNLYPDALGQDFRDTCMEYYYAVRTLAQDIMRAMALGLGLDETYFDSFALDRPSCVMRLIHYPPTPTTSSLERGVGAHRDFGCVTVLLQDEVGGLQVQDERTGEWLNVLPTRGAFVVNVGNTLMRWTNHHFTSGTHRVMNLSHGPRYSVPFFFNGNSLKVIDTVQGCERRKDTVDRPFGPPLKQEAYEPIVLRDYLHEQFESSYVTANA